jgi:hypothetical protein
LKEQSFRSNKEKKDNKKSPTVEIQLLPYNSYSHSEKEKEKSKYSSDPQEFRKVFTNES